MTPAMRGGFAPGEARPPRLPSLDCLRFFEAAARRESFARAADELFVTPAAVAQRIKGLEDHLGQALFERRHRGIRLNRQGRAYLAEIETSLFEIQAATERHARNGRAERLRIEAPEAVAERWLLPILAEFKAAAPDTAVEVAAGCRRSEADEPSPDVRIGYAGEGGDAEPPYDEILFEEWLFPVCSPGLLDGRTPPWTPRDLRDWPLLVERGRETAWAAWFARHNCPLPSLTGAWRLELHAWVVQAATAGWGVALGHSLILAPELDAGALVPVLGARARTRVRCGFATPSSAEGNPAVEKFRDWLRTRRD